MKFFATLFATLVLIAPVQAYAVGGILGCGASVAGGAVGGAHVAAQSVAGSASGLPVSDLGTHINTSIGNLNTGAITAKECVLDGIGIALAEGMISALSQGIVDWINGGFEGSPAFVTDLNGFLGEVADHTALDFIEGTELGFLCSPFELDVRITLAVQRQPFQERIRCSLGEVIDNADRFFSGDFSQGGWPAWFKVHTDLQNMPYGALLLASAELDARIDSRVGEERTLLNFGNGIFSKGKCVSGGSTHAGGNTPNHAGGTNYPSNSKFGCISSGGKWTIVTPGQQIEEQLNNAIGAGQRRLEVADEFDEIINALLAQLSRQALTSIDGLVGLSSRSSSSAQTTTRQNPDGSTTTTTGSYLDTLVNQTDDASIDTAQDALLDDIDTAIRIEEDYQDVLEDLIRNLEGAEEEFGDLYACYISITQNPASVTGITSVGALQAASSTQATVATIITPQIKRYEDALDASVRSVQRLIAVRAEARNARELEDLNDAAEKYDAILTEGVVHSAADLAFLIQDLEVQLVSIDALNDQTNADTRTCRGL